MGIFKKSILPFFAAASMLVACRQEKPAATPAPLEPATEDVFTPSIKAYPESGMVVQEISPQNMIIADYTCEELTEIVIEGGTIYQPLDSVAHIRFTVRFNDIRDTTDANTIKTLRQYLPDTLQNKNAPKPQ